MAVEVITSVGITWSTAVDALSTPDDVTAADAAMQHALAANWFAFEKSAPFDIEIECDTSEDLRLYAQTRKLIEESIPYAELDSQQRAAAGSRLRCRRPWMLSTYRQRR